MSGKKDEYESRYAAYVQFACLITLFAIVVIDSLTNTNHKEVELALIAAFSGLFSKEKIKQMKKKK